MVKKLTLNETWKQCLAMWKWIAEQRKQDKNTLYLRSVGELKSEWLKNHPQFKGIKDLCFFCDWARSCLGCPGVLINKRFRCENRTYHYWDKPLKFYAKLLDLNKKRKSK